MQNKATEKKAGREQRGLTVAGETLVAWTKVEPRSSPLEVTATTWPAGWAALVAAAYSWAAKLV